MPKSQSKVSHIIQSHSHSKSTETYYNTHQNIKYSLDLKTWVDVLRC
jgi:hypothetical protein